MKSKEHQVLIDEFLRRKRYATSTEKMVNSQIHSFLIWADCDSAEKLCCLNGEIAVQYFQQRYQNVSPITMCKDKRCLKEFYKYLRDIDVLPDAYAQAFEFYTAVARRIRQPISESDMALLLDSIDRNTTKGKRDYAILLLGISTGLRGVDIFKLKLKDINWLQGEIQVCQSKTKVPLSLPLTQDVGQALKDYILNARPASNCDTVFLKWHTPHDPYTLSSIATETMARNCHRAGLPPRGFHDLRRLIAYT